MASTYEQIRTEVFEIVGEKTTATVLSLENKVKPLINTVEEEICEWLVYDEVNKRNIKGWDFRPLMKNYGINLVEDGKLTAAASSGAVTLSLDTTDFSSTWYGWINRNLVTYTWKTSTTLTWVTWVDVSHASGEVIKQAYAIPSTAVDTIQIRDNTNNKQVEILDYRDDKTYEKYCAIYPNNETDDTSFLVFFWFGSEQVRVLYQRGYTALSASTDESNLPWQNWLKVTAKIVAWRLMIDTNYDYQRWLLVLSQWYGNLARLYTKLWKIHKWFKNKIQIKPFISYYS